MVRHWTVFGIGFWTLLSPWLLGFSEIAFARWSNVVVGLILIVMETWTIFGNSPPLPQVETPAAKQNIKK